MKKLIILSIAVILLFNSCGILTEGAFRKRILISTNPIGAEVYRNGKSTGKYTPCKVKARKKRCSFTIKKEGYYEYKAVIKRTSIDDYFNKVSLLGIPFIPFDIIFSSIIGYQDEITELTLKSITCNLINIENEQKKNFEEKKKAEINAEIVTSNELNNLKASKSRIGVTYFSAESNMMNFDNHVKISNNAFLKWKDNFGGRKEIQYHKMNDTLYDKYDNNISYIGEVDVIEKIRAESNPGYEIQVKNIMKGKGVCYLTGGKIQATWTENYVYDYSIPATMYYDNNTTLTGYWIPDNYIRAKGGGTVWNTFNENAKDWHYLGDESTYQSNLGKLISAESEYYTKLDNQVTTNINNRNAFIENNYTSISSKVESEKMNYDGGNYKRYTIKFIDGKTDDVRYYSDSGEWCVYTMLLEDYCYKDKGKTLCRMYWDLTH